MLQSECFGQLFLVTFVSYRSFTLVLSVGFDQLSFQIEKRTVTVLCKHSV